jgi:hypothetical protein
MKRTNRQYELGLNKFVHIMKASNCNHFENH